MRTQDEIGRSIRLSNVTEGTMGGSATITLPSGFCGSVFWGRDEGGWEHVSMASYRRHKMPTWQDMCDLKDVFFGPDEEAVQIHPVESEYVHGVGTLANRIGNVMHLWRPKDGNWSIMNRGDGRC